MPHPRDDVVETSARLRALVFDHLPVTVHVDPTSAVLTEWQEVAPALVVRMAHTKAGATALLVVGDLVDSLVLARVLYEHMVVFAWLAADPEHRLPRWVGHDERRRLTAAGDWASVGQEAFSEPVLGFAREMRERFPERLTAERCAREADDHWHDKLDGLLNVPNERGSFRGMYRSLFRWTSSYVHPTREALRDFAHPGAPGEVVVDGRMRDRARAQGWDPWSASLSYLSLALLVSARSLGWPDYDDVYVEYAGFLARGAGLDLDRAAILAQRDEERARRATST